jgi:hypothetical protein
MIMKKILGLVAVLFVTYSFGSAELNLNSNSIGALVDWRIHKKGYTNYYLGGRYVNNGKVTVGGHSFDGDSAKSTLASFNFKMMNQYRYRKHNIQGFGLGMGMSAEYIDFDEGSQDFLATPLRLYGNMQFDYRISFDIDLAYAPEMLTFQDGVEYSELKAKFNFRVIDNGYVFAGFRHIQAKYDYTDDNDQDQKYTVKLDRDIFGGFKIVF